MHKPLNLPQDRSKQIKKAIEADDGFISAGDSLLPEVITNNVLMQLITMLCERQILPWDEAERMCKRLQERRQG
jgi:hypothetical protein